MRHRTSRSRRAAAARSVQAGSFLLEALIAVLIIALAILGLVGLLAHSMQNIDDAKFRGEAAYLANSLIGDMWLADKATLLAQYDSGGGGAKYVEFASLVAQRLPNAGTYPPTVTVTAGAPPTSSAGSTIVQIEMHWLPPGEASSGVPHKHWATAVIATN